MDNGSAAMATKQKNRGRFFYVCPPVSFAFAVFFLIAVALRFIGGTSASAADFISKTVGAVTRGAATYLTCLLPFSLAETLLFASPVLLGLVIRRAIVCAKRHILDLLRFFIILVSIALLIFGLFLTSISVSYDCTRVEDKLELDTETLVQNDYYEAAKILLTEIADVTGEIEFDETGASVMPYSLGELSKKLNAAYDLMNADVKLTQTLPSRAKPLALSEPMMYTHFSGIYTYFTGEANLNVNYPDFIVASTAAHEFAHQRGIAPEDEASFIALIVSLYSDDPYIRYSGCLDIYCTVASELRKAAPDLYKQLISEYMLPEVNNELTAYSVMFEKYRENTVAKISDKVNDSYLKGQGQAAGTKSYDMVFSLAVAYLVRAYGK